MESLRHQLHRDFEEEKSKAHNLCREVLHPNLFSCESAVLSFNCSTLLEFSLQKLVNAQKKIKALKQRLADIEDFEDI